jgi:hypothetical protein
VGLVGTSGPSKPLRQYFKGPAPTKKMKPLHWDKLDIPDDGLSVWHRIYNGTACDVTFDYEEFENLFSQKEVEVKKVAPKPRKVMLLDEGVHRNLSIVLHKLPSIPNVQKALLELDDQVLNREALIAMLAQAPTDETKKAFLANAAKKPEEEYEPQEKYMAMMITMPEFKRRVSAWLFTMEWGDSCSAVQKPMRRLQAAMDAIVGSHHLPYYLGVLLGFGNMMNYGDSRKGNAPAVALSLFDKLELTKDNRGKISLLGHLINTVKTRNPDAFAVAEELKPLVSNVTQIKWEDIEKSVQEAEKAVSLFQSQVAAVKKTLVNLGADTDDPFIPFTAEFSVKASNELKEIQTEYEALKAAHVKLCEYFAYDPKKKKPEEIFAEIIPFVEKVRKAAQELAKELRKTAKKGQRLGEGQLSSVVEKLQEQMASS